MQKIKRDDLIKCVFMKFSEGEKSVKGNFCKKEAEFVIDGKSLCMEHAIYFTQKGKAFEDKDNALQNFADKANTLHK